MEKYAKVIVRSNTFHTDNLFTYKIPEFLKIRYMLVIGF